MRRTGKGKRERQSGAAKKQGEMEMGLLWTIISLLVLFWIVGLVANIAGPIIHLLLVVAAVLFVANMFMGRTRV